MDRNTRDVSGDSEAMLSFFNCSKFSFWVCNTSDVHTGQTFVINWSKTQLSWVLMLYYPYKTMFSAYKSVIVSPCACDLFVSKVTNGCPFLAVIFRHFFSVWWLYLEINQSLVAEIICTMWQVVRNGLQTQNKWFTIYWLWRQHAVKNNKHNCRSSGAYIIYT